MARCRTESGHTAIWWEKTVEYAYLAESVSDGGQLVPFAGPLERAAGDAVEIVGNEFLIIEFKDYFSSKALQQENNKFRPQYRPYREFRNKIIELGLDIGRDFNINPHCFASRNVFMKGGYCCVSDSFDIKYSDYWSSSIVEIPQRCAADEFVDYLKCLNEMRQPSSQGDIPQGTIYGYSSDGCIVSVCELEYVLQALRSKKFLKLTDCEDLVQKHKSQTKFSKKL